MTGLLKSAEAAHRARPARFAAASLCAEPGSDPVEAPPDPVVEELLVRNEKLANSLAARDARIAEIENARNSAFERGREAGLEAAERGEAARLQTLKRGVAEALERFVSSLESTERLAAMLARKCLDRLFGDPDWRADTVMALLREQLETIANDAVVRIEVSAEDFASPEALRALLPADSAIDIRCDGALASGGCRIALQLGGMEVGLNEQWSRLGSALDALALPDAAQ